MRTYPRLKTKYTSLPVSVEQAKKWLRLDIPGFTGEDEKIEELIGSAVDYVETECKLSLGLSDYEWYANCLPCEIPDQFLVDSITSIEELFPSGYTVIADTNYFLVPVSERSSKIQWISSFETSSTVFRVNFKAGYADGKIPKRLLQAVRGLIAEWYDSPGDYVREKKTMVDRLLEPFVIAYAG
ncbi:hypothetical protein [Dyadobacter fermentans]|uniref:Phage gp6-like head-tail connector protein n=1 Tax=Dyadobacter fermentans (strain ATCC 700827 / DSM 18053 / CIP 107007 / KCTC 52180 / NS114) TaxID=471854 RepID=C6VVH1_DYAFD|nr:hypothetical protein [Dyadobacter fermentans]ACT96701.1 hypothetical protein Dfer_5510 [Dyadobacter fermentans DSM 18053]